MIAKQYLVNVYGDEVSIEYHDAANPDTQTQYADAVKGAEDRRYSYPLVLLNGEVKTSGGVSAYQLMFLVDQDRREKGLPSRF